MVRRWVLIVEDDPALGDTVVDVLQMLDFETELVSDGLVAVDKIIARMPNIVLLDLNLPGKSGVEILNEIRADERLAKIKVIVVSADAQRARMVADKADFVLIKPYTIAQLSGLVNRSIDQES